MKQKKKKKKKTKKIRKTNQSQKGNTTIPILQLQPFHTSTILYPTQGSKKKNMKKTPKTLENPTKATKKSTPQPFDKHDSIRLSLALLSTPTKLSKTHAALSLNMK